MATTFPKIKPGDRLDHFIGPGRLLNIREEVAFNAPSGQVLFGFVVDYANTHSISCNRPGCEAGYPDSQCEFAEGRTYTIYIKRIGFVDAYTERFDDGSVLTALASAGKHGWLKYLRMWLRMREMRRPIHINVHDEGVKTSFTI